jgi:hypothetical protein
VKPPAFGSSQGVFCGSAQSAVDGKLSVGMGKLTDPEHHQVDCTSVGVVDLQSGKMLWTNLIIPAANEPPDRDPIEGMLTEISGTTVMATWQAAATAFSVTDGHRLWLKNFDAPFRDLAAGNGSFYGLLVNLVPFSDQFAMAAARINPANGKVIAQLPLTGAMTRTGQPQTGAIVSTSPLTLLVGDESDKDNASFVVIDSTLKHVTQAIRAGSQEPQAADGILFAVENRGNAYSHPSVNAIVSGGTLIAVSYPTTGQADYGLVAYDLATGARRWAATEPSVEIVSPVAVDGSAVVTVGSIYKGGNQTDASIVRFNLATGAVLSDTPRSTGRDPVGQAIGLYHFTWADGRTYAANWSQSSDIDTAPAVYSMSTSG